MSPKNAPGALKHLWEKNFFQTARHFDEIRKEIGALGCNPPDTALHMALSRASFLTRKGERGKFTYVQRHNPKAPPAVEDVLSEDLIRRLGHSFDTEIQDLRLNYGKSGTCTAFLMRKILEKLVFLVFAKNGLDKKLRDSNGDFVGLKTMLNLATAEKVQGKPFLMPKTAKEIEGIKFLGDTAAHNPLINVDMKTLVPQMPFIITAYAELSKKL